MATIEAILKNPEVLAGLSLAWRDSLPGSSDGHEEGGFIVQNATGSLQVIRWPRGTGNTIDVPTHRGCRAEGLEILASFHTHPNTGPDYLQEPSETEKRAVRDDQELKAPNYGDELVISAVRLHLVTPYGSVVPLGETERMLAQA
jgi:hypothetical protein